MSSVESIVQGCSVLTCTGPTVQLHWMFPSEEPLGNKTFKSSLFVQISISHCRDQSISNEISLGMCEGVWRQMSGESSALNVLKEEVDVNTQGCPGGNFNTSWEDEWDDWKSFLVPQILFFYLVYNCLNIWNLMHCLFNGGGNRWWVKH
jgi:hypothetical protein